MPVERESRKFIQIESGEIRLSAERLASIVGGGALLALSWPWRRSPAGVGAMIGGGLLVYWGVTGDPRLCQIFGYRSQTKSGVASVRHNRSVRVEKAIVVDGVLRDIYRIWRNPENLPCFAEDLKSVRAISDLRSHWVMKGPAGKDLEWESEIYNERENESFAWRSMLNADVNHAGSVHFQSLPDSKTEIRVILSYEPPGGMLGSWAAKLSGSDPELQLERGLVRFKEAFETGQLTVH